MKKSYNILFDCAGFIQKTCIFVISKKRETLRKSLQKIRWRLFKGLLEGWYNVTLYRIAIIEHSILKRRIENCNHRKNNLKRAYCSTAGICDIRQNLHYQTLPTLWHMRRHTILFSLHFLRVINNKKALLSYSVFITNNCSLYLSFYLLFLGRNVGMLLNPAESKKRICFLSLWQRSSIPMLSLERNAFMIVDDLWSWL